MENREDLPLINGVDVPFSFLTLSHSPSFSYAPPPFVNLGMKFL
jgi:hypothetical protein